MMLPSSKLIPLLNEISSYLNQLLNALVNEHDALSNNNLPKIESIAQEKIILMEHLEDLDKERRSLLKSSGFDLNSTDLDELFQNNSSPRAPLMKSAWEQISKLTRACDRQNNINGIIIENNKRHTENALSILQGRQQTTELYSNKGTSIKMPKNQTLIRA